MNSELDKLRKEMTREEFISEYAGLGTTCPDDLFNLTSYWGKEKCKKCTDPICIECYSEAVKDIQFKDDIEAIEEVLGKKEELSTIQDSGDRTLFNTGAVRDIHEGKGRMDLLPAAAVIRLSKHFENGAKKYDERNWEKGIPVHSFIDSAIRHLMNYLDGKTDEDHLCAAAWNCMCAMWTEEKKPELQDIPSRAGEKE